MDGINHWHLSSCVGSCYCSAPVNSVSASLANKICSVRCLNFMLCFYRSEQWRLGPKRRINSYLGQSLNLRSLQLHSTTHIANMHCHYTSSKKASKKAQQKNLSWLPLSVELLSSWVNNKVAVSLPSNFWPRTAQQYLHKWVPSMSTTKLTPAPLFIDLWKFNLLGGYLQHCEAAAFQITITTHFWTGTVLSLMGPGMSISLKLQVQLHEDLLPQIHTWNQCWTPHIATITWNNLVLTLPHLKSEAIWESPTCQHLECKRCSPGSPPTSSVRKMKHCQHSQAAELQT